MIERLPTPWGLVRSGVAPDHPKIKSVTRVYEKTAAHPRFRYFGNVSFGEHVVARGPARALPRDRLRDRLADGPPARHPRRRAARLARGDRVRRLVQRPPRPHRPGGRPRVGRARRRDRQRQRRGRRRADADAERRGARADRHRRPRARGARAQPRAGGRRGRPPRPRAGRLHQPRAARARRADRRRRGRRRRTNSSARSPCTTRPPSRTRHRGATSRSCAATPAHADRRAQARRAALPALAGRADRRRGRRAVAASSSCATSSCADEDGALRARATEQSETISAGLVFRAIGYRGEPLPGVSFDERAAVILNEGGRVLDPDSRAPLPGEYVVGWIKRGPSGVIGTNKKDAQETVDAMLADLAPSANGAGPAAAGRGRRDKAHAQPARRRGDRGAAARAPAGARHVLRLGGDRPSRARARRARRAPAREADARSTRCCASPPPKRPDGPRRRFHLDLRTSAAALRLPPVKHRRGAPIQGQ